MLLAASAFTPLPNLVSRWLGTAPRLEPSDAVVVLGNQLLPDGMLGANSVRRTVHGVGLYRRGFAPLLVLLGPSRPEGGRTEAEVRAELARDLGVAAQGILTDGTARTTREEALHVRALLGPRGVRRILLVTESRHLARARGLFERAGFEVLPAPADGAFPRASEPEARLGLMRGVLEELLARLYYRVAGYL